MRLFIITYQKSGTHQIMPAFEAYDDIVDRSNNNMRYMPKYVHVSHKLNEAGIKETSEALATFGGYRFGHISYLPQYAKALQEQPTKVLFNVRDPRDVVVAEWHRMLQIAEKDPSHAWLNFTLTDGSTILYSEDPIKYLITFARSRWRAWIGWMKHDFVYTVKYEDLRLKGIETLNKIKEFLAPEIEINPAWNYEHLKPKPRNPTFRKGVPGEWKETFTDAHKEQAEKELGDIITKLGYEI